MKVVSSLALVVAIGWISGCATSPQQIASVPLNATPSNAGNVGKAMLTPIGKDTELYVFVGGVPNDTTLPAHLYTYVYSGTCGNLSPEPAFALNQSVNTEFNQPDVGFQLWKRVPVAYDTLRSGSYAVVVRASPADGNRDIFCGNLG
ncbi:hypothetical protein D9M71_201880 [compost metagenome]